MVTQAKLTLRLDKKLILRAKLRSEKTGKSLSQMVADFFALMDEEIPKELNNLPPLTRSLKGALRGKKLSKDDYRRYLKEKYQ